MVVAATAAMDTRRSAGLPSSARHRAHGRAHGPDLDGIQATWLVSSKVPLGGVIMVTSEERIDFSRRR